MIERKKCHKQEMIQDFLLFFMWWMAGGSGLAANMSIGREKLRVLVAEQRIWIRRVLMVVFPPGDIKSKKWLF